MRFFRNNKVKIFLTVFLVYLFYTSPGYLSANTNRFIALTKSIVDDKTFAIDKYHNMTCDKAFYDGHYYAGAAPGLGFLAIPVYLASKPLLDLIPTKIYKNIEFNMLNLFFTLFLSVLPGAIIAVLLYDILLEFNLRKEDRLLIVFASSFGTLLFFTSTRLFAHTMSTFLMFAAFYILFKFKNKPVNKYIYLLSGLSLGMAVLLEYSQAIGAILFALYAFLNFKREKISHYFLFIIGSFFMAIVFMGYHYICFDGPFTLASTYSSKIGPVPFSMLRPKIVFELTFGTYRGIFTYMPILLISAYGIFLFLKSSEKKYLSEIIFTCLYSVLVFFSFNMLANWHWPWGGSFGIRHSVCFVPFLMIPIVYAYRKIGYKIVLWVAIISILINWCGVQYGDADNAFINVGLFIFRGLNSNLAEWTYKLTNTYIRKLNVITHFSPLIGLIVLFIFIYFIWKIEIDRLARVYFYRNSYE